MEPSSQSESQEQDKVAEPYRCAYCGGSLDLRHDFCVHCGTAHRAPDEKVWGWNPPPAPSVETRIADQGRPALNLFFLLAAFIVCGAFLRAAIGKEMLGASLLIQDILVAILTLGFAIPHRAEIAHLFRGVRAGVPLAVSLPLLGVLLALNFGYHALIMSLLGMNRDESELSAIRDSLSPALLIVTICVFPAIFEEIGFRGLVQERLVAAAGPMVGFAGTSVLFTALHFSVLSAPYLFVLGLYLSWVRDRTGSIYPAMVLHFLHNAVVLYLYGGAR